MLVPVQVDAQGRRVRRRITETADTFTYANYQVEERSGGSWVIIANGPEDHEAAMDMVRLLRDIAPDPSFVRTHVAPPPVTGPMLEQRVELFLEQFNQKLRAQANKLDTAFTMRLFVGIIGGKALADVGAEDMDRWLDALAHWPPNATKREPYKDLSPREVVIVSKRKGETPISLRTREMYCDTPARWWLPLLALYSGGRAQEVAQLHTQDIEEVSGIWGFHIAARFPGQKLKNRQSRRFVPLHPALLDAGMLNYRDDIVGTLGEGPLFPGLGAKPGDAIGNWLNRTYLRNQCHVQG